MDSRFTLGRSKNELDHRINIRQNGRFSLKTGAICKKYPPQYVDVSGSKIYNILAGSIYLINQKIVPIREGL